MRAEFLDAVGSAAGQDGGPSTETMVAGGIALALTLVYLFWARAQSDGKLGQARIAQEVAKNPAPAIREIFRADTPSQDGP